MTPQSYNLDIYIFGDTGHTWADYKGPQKSVEMLVEQVSGNQDIMPWYNWESLGLQTSVSPKRNQS